MGKSTDELERMQVTDFITFDDFEKNIENAEKVYNSAKDDIENNPAQAEVNTDTSSIEEAELTWQDAVDKLEERAAKTEVRADTSPAINTVTSGISVMNTLLGSINTPNVNANTSPAVKNVNNGVASMNGVLGTVKTVDINVETAYALNKAEKLRGSIETALKGINIGLKITVKEKIMDAMTAAINIGKAAKLGIGGIEAYSIPYLASGAVIPPNKEFMAVLGDQKHGMNIEAPADLIKQMVMEGINESGTTADKEVIVNVYLEGDADGVFNLVKVENDKRKKQTGSSLLG